jgi:hypothetical protein
MRADDRREFVKILQAHAQTVGVCEACALTTRELATEVARGGIPPRADLVRTIEEADGVLSQLEATRKELERLMAAFS